MADNSLGLQIAPEDIPAPPEITTQEDATEEQQPKAPRSKPYVNPDRVKTGGAQRVGRRRRLLRPPLIVCRTNSVRMHSRNGWQR